jgi:hypothetical protein
MTIDEIIHMAKEAGMPDSLCEDWFLEPLDSFALKFAYQIAAAEREACAKEISAEISDELEDEAYCILVALLARIRARGQG